MNLQTLDEAFARVENLRKLKAILENMEQQTKKPAFANISFDEEIADLQKQIEKLTEWIEHDPVRQWISDIPDPYLQDIFRLRYLNALTWKEVARITNGSESSVKSSVFRYLKRRAKAG